jgi:single-stranded DNA-binding protein
MATGKKDRVQWHNCQAWGETAVIAANIKKGDLFKAKGTIQYNKYKEKVYTNIVLFEVELNPASSKKVGDTVLIDGEEYEVVADEPKADEPLPF